MFLFYLEKTTPLKRAATYPIESSTESPKNKAIGMN